MLEKGKEIEPKLDRILEILYARRFDHINIDPLPVDQLCQELPFNNRNLNHEEIIELFNILHEFGYIYYRPEQTVPLQKVKYSSITLKGAQFIENGGYKKLHEGVKRKENFESLKSNILLIGSIIAGVYSILKILEMIIRLAFNCSNSGSI